MTKSRIGPFALEAPLTPAKRTGQVFRGIHLEQRKLAALRIFPIPMGMTPESRQAFARQLEELKQLRHAGIVRCYGGGFDSRKAYLAYELVDGEALETLLARRQRLSWEAALETSQQLTEALQYAHQLGWVHGRLRPSKVLVTADGTAKISDWRRDAISSMMGDGPTTTAHIQYTAPEALAGAEPNAKSDLYSLGAIIYTLLTGSAPFAGDDPQALTQHIQNTPAPSVSAHVLDCPVWLNAIVEQLLSKDPQQRPFSATALLLAFEEARRRQSQGVGVLQHVTAGFSPLQLKGDREEAEKLLGIKPAKARKAQQEGSFFDKPWVLFTALLAGLAVAVWFMLPLSESSLRRKAEALLPPHSQEWLEWKEARDSYLTALTERFPEGEHAGWAAKQIAWVHAREAERDLERDQRLGREESWSPSQIRYAEGRRYEQFGDMATALEHYRAVTIQAARSAEDRPLVDLAQEGIARIQETGLGRYPVAAFLNRRLAEAASDYDRARISEAKATWESIVALYAANPELAPLVEEAQQRLNSLGGTLRPGRSP